MSDFTPVSLSVSFPNAKGDGWTTTTLAGVEADATCPDGSIALRFPIDVAMGLAAAVNAVVHPSGPQEPLPELPPHPSVPEIRKHLGKMDLKTVRVCKAYVAANQRRAIDAKDVDTAKVLGACLVDLAKREEELAKGAGKDKAA